MLVMWYPLLIAHIPLVMLSTCQEFEAILKVNLQLPELQPHMF